MLTRVAVDEAIDAHLNSRAARPIFQRIDPFQIDLGHLDTHPYTVSYGLQSVKQTAILSLTQGPHRGVRLVVAGA